MWHLRSGRGSTMNDKGFPTHKGELGTIWPTHLRCLIDPLKVVRWTLRSSILLCTHLYWKVSTTKGIAWPSNCYAVMSKGHYMLLLKRVPKNEVGVWHNKNLLPSTIPIRWYAISCIGWINSLQLTLKWTLKWYKQFHALDSKLWYKLWNPIWARIKMQLG